MEIEKMRKEAEFSRKLLDMICEITNDKKMLCFRDSQNLNKKIVDIIEVESVTDEQYDKLTQIIKQFNMIIDDFIKEENIKGE